MSETPHGFFDTASRRSGSLELACTERDIFPSPDDVLPAARREYALPDDEATSYSQSRRFAAMTTAGDDSSAPNGVSPSPRRARARGNRHEPFHPSLGAAMTTDAIPTVFGFKKPGLSLSAISRPSMTPLPRCSQCPRVAESFHSFYGREPSQLACGDHDPGGYWFYLYRKERGRASLGSGLEHWLRHLADEHPSVLRDLLTWLATPDGIVALRQIASYGTSTTTSGGTTP